MEYLRKFGVIPVCLSIFAMSVYVASHDTSHPAFTVRMCFYIFSAPIIVLVYLVIGESRLFTPPNMFLLLGIQWILVSWFMVRLPSGVLRKILSGVLIALMLFGIFIMTNPYIWRMAI